MRIIDHQTVEYEIWLNEEEASFLKALLQNGPQDEDSTSKKIREALWTELHQKGI